MRTRRVPRATRRPRGREEVLPSSSGFGVSLECALSVTVKGEVDW
jgi:hypothetical protein